MPRKPAKSATVPTGGTMKVRATMLGYFGERRRRPGDVFTIPTSAFAAKWMEEVDPHTQETSTPPNAALRQEHANLMTGRAPQLQHNAADPLEEDDEPEGDTGGTGNRNVLGG